MIRTTFFAGRSQECDLVVTDASVSRVHAEMILHADGTLRIIDKNSSNGVYVYRQGAWQRVPDITLDLTASFKLGARELTVADVVQALETVVLANKDRVAVDTIRLNQPRRNPLTGEIEES